MCINTKHNMSIIEKVFKHGETELSVIKCKDDIWFRGKTLAEVLGYSNPLKAIHTHIDSEDKKEIPELVYKGGAQNRHPFRNVQRETIYINDSGLYFLVLRSKLESAKAFKQWVTSQVLPSIGKKGRYDYCIDHKYNNTLIFKIESEMDHHVKVISFLKKRYPHSLFTVTLGENQDTVHKKIDSFKKGYLRGSPDLIINNLHKRYSSFAIEMKSPKRNGVLSPDQSMILQQYQSNGSKTLVNNDVIIEQITEYFRDVRILCSHCPRRFISSQSLRNHIRGFHKM